jgi:hypothetical protein
MPGQDVEYFVFDGAFHLFEIKREKNDGVKMNDVLGSLKINASRTADVKPDLS